MLLMHWLVDVINFYIWVCSIINCLISSLLIFFLHWILLNFTIKSIELCQCCFSVFYWSLHTILCLKCHRTFIALIDWTSYRKLIKSSAATNIHRRIASPITNCRIRSLSSNRLNIRYRLLLFDPFLFLYLRNWSLCHTVRLSTILLSRGNASLNLRHFDYWSHVWEMRLCSWISSCNFLTLLNKFIIFSLDSKFLYIRYIINAT
jgi:hypothetical protein